jgi:hypothetical protein
VHTLPASIDRVFAAAPELELLALDPWSEDAGRRVEDSVFHDFTVLRRRAVSAPDTRQEVLDVVRRGVREHPEFAAHCFTPRHGLRARADGHVADLVICYECTQMRLYLDGRRQRDLLIGDMAEPDLTALYEAHGLPIAPRSD